jgi:hypothetical protein
MKYAAFDATSPFEIGDKVIIDGCRGETVEITDIACIYYVKSRKVEFRYSLNNSKNYLPLEFVNEGSGTV